jgi:DNA repair exonuclease SbcCD ATPase subunit
MKPIDPDKIPEFSEEAERNIQILKTLAEVEHSQAESEKWRAEAKTFGKFWIKLVVAGLIAGIAGSLTFFKFLSDVYDIRKEQAEYFEEKAEDLETEIATLQKEKTDLSAQKEEIEKLRGEALAEKKKAEDARDAAVKAVTEERDEKSREVEKLKSELSSKSASVEEVFEMETKLQELEAALADREASIEGLQKKQIPKQENTLGYIRLGKLNEKGYWSEVAVKEKPQLYDIRLNQKFTMAEDYSVRSTLPKNDDNYFSILAVVASAQRGDRIIVTEMPAQFLRPNGDRDVWIGISNLDD